MGKRKPKPVSVLDCRPEDRCDGDPKVVAPLPEAETRQALVEVRDWFRACVESGKLKPKKKKKINWENHPKVTWVPTFFLVEDTTPAAGTTNSKGIKVSTVQLWRRRGLVRHEACHWWYYQILGGYDVRHKQEYLN